jgi:hypothetical protein
LVKVGVAFALGDDNCRVEEPVESVGVAECRVLPEFGNLVGR